MKNTFCPISNKKINENVARINGGFVVVLLLIYFLTLNVLPILFLLIDFYLRSIEKTKYSILNILSKKIVSILKIETKLINAGPKIFAAKIGFLFSIIIFMLSLVNLTLTPMIFASIFCLCAFSESVFGFCVACSIYPYWYKIIYKV